MSGLFRLQSLIHQDDDFAYLQPRELCIQEQILIGDRRSSALPIKDDALADAEHLGKLTAGNVVIHFKFTRPAVAAAVALVVLQGAANEAPKLKIVLAQKL